jgi:hypothetical protein
MFYMFVVYIDTLEDPCQPPPPPPPQSLTFDTLMER